MRRLLFFPLLVSMLCSGCSLRPYTIFQTVEGVGGASYLVEVPHGATKEQMKAWGEQIRGAHQGQAVIVNFYDGPHDIHGFVGSYEIDQFHPPSQSQ